jgi:hypothetical protein
MAKKPSLPSRPEDTWEGGFVLDRVQKVLSVSGPGGLVLGGGEHLYMLRPGAQRWMRREPMTELGRVLAVAAEPRHPWRYAVSSEKGLTVYGLPNDQKLTLTAPDDDPPATHLGWGTFEEQSVLYLRWADGTAGRLRLDLGQVESLELLPMDALATDASGSVAVVSLQGDTPHALFTQDGIRFEERPAVRAPQNLAGPVHLAVAGAAVAYAIEGWGTYVSRGLDDDFLPVEALAPGGALAFQGTDPASPLFGAVWTQAHGAILRVDAGGDVQRIGETSGTGVAAPRITSLAWDGSRSVLWSSSPDAGILRNEEPTAKGEKKRVLS